ncbi:hypothetical protein ID866_4253 [Astraeus odoratus]|nr:hypothetical protein ID866_4253 [Astraeus odoratus]
MSDVHAIAQSGYDSGTNELYDRARPSYPGPSLTFIKSAAAKSEALNIVEIGAGTGLFTRALLSHPDWSPCITRLRAVEPSEGMRKVWAEKNVEDKATIEDGTFQGTTVTDGWADLVIVAQVSGVPAPRSYGSPSLVLQAFHWCPDYDKACAEFARILKKDGAVVFIWNLESRDRAAWAAQVRDCIERHEQGTPQFRLGLWRQAFATSSYIQNFHEPEEKVWDYHVVTTEQLAIDRALSKSYISVLPPEQKASVVSELIAIMARGDDRVWVDQSRGMFEYPYQTLVVWISGHKSLTLTDTITPTHLADLYITLPTRDGTRGRPFQPPQEGTPLGYGHHLAFFHPRNPESALRSDGTDAEFCPPESFTRRMWAGGTMQWNSDPRGALRVGQKASAVSTVASVKKKGFDGDPDANPMVFVTQRIEITSKGREEPSVVEERSHVYLASAGSERAVREGMGSTPREHVANAFNGGVSLRRTVHGLPSPDFSFTYRPSLTTLFRFSALTFNAHYIHLDKDFAQKSEGYPERLVHGPLTALMLLEALLFNRPELQLRTFSYRARNPLVVNRRYEAEVICMTGRVSFAS